MKKLILILIALPCLALEHPLSIGGHTLNFYNSEPTEIVDRSGNGNNGTVHGTTLANDGSDNVVGSFDGVDDYITLDSQIVLGTNATLCYWANYSGWGTGGSGNQSMLFGSSSYPFGTYSYYSKSVNTLYYYNSGWLIYAPVVIQLSNWVYYSWVQNSATETVALYTNGVFVRTRPMNVVTNMVLYKFGEGLSAYSYNGKLDNVSGYSKCLDSSEITALYTAGRTASKGAISTNGLVAFYDFNPPDRALATLEPTWYFSDLVGWWAMLNGNNPTVDESNNSNDGTVNGATYDGLNNGYSFDGIDDYIDCGNSSDFDFDFGAQDFTLSAWVNSSGAGSYQMIIDKKLASGTYNGYSLLFTSANVFEFAIRNGSTKAVQTPLTYNDGTWHLVFGIKSGDNLYLYVDGYLKATVTGVNAYDIDTTQPLAIGARNGGSYPFHGNIDDPRIYNRALTASEILTIYNGTKGTH